MLPNVFHRLGDSSLTSCFHIYVNWEARNDTEERESVSGSMSPVFSIYMEDTHRILPRKQYRR